jgi:hypothetical protein
MFVGKTGAADIRLGWKSLPVSLYLAKILWKICQFHLSKIKSSKPILLKHSYATILKSSYHAKISAIIYPAYNIAVVLSLFKD